MAHEYKYAHMCRDGHEQIGHNDSEFEQCPLCRMTGERDNLREKLDWTAISPDNPVRLGDQVLDSGTVCAAIVIPENLDSDWIGCGFDYRRPLNAPLAAQHVGSK